MKRRTEKKLVRRKEIGIEEKERKERKNGMEYREAWE